MLIGVTVKGEAMGGVIYQPYYNYKSGPNAKLGRAIWGVIGMGKDVFICSLLILKLNNYNLREYCAKLYIYSWV